MEALLGGRADERCDAVVIVPARNEERHLRAAVNALAQQKATDGRSIPRSSFEVLLLLNNCSDRSAVLARELAREHTDEVQLHILERALGPDEAHVGMARRLLMDTAWQRLEGRPGGAILSTDADTMVAPDWLAQNLKALRSADVVGGEICWAEGELEQLPAGVRQAYRRDRELQALVAEVESLLDPVPEDPWPRHLHTFGASLACTAQAYAAAGGLPVQPALEDAEFVRQARRAGARVRHEPRVRVYTSGRLHGQVEVGLSGQLREWKRLSDAGLDHTVPSAELILHRANWIGAVRRYATTQRVEELQLLPEMCRGEVRHLAGEEHAPARLIERCADVVEGAFQGAREGEVEEQLCRLRAELEQLRLETRHRDEEQLVTAVD